MSLLDRLGITVPVIGAGMGGGLSGPPLTIAIGRAGGLGQLGMASPAVMRDGMAAHREADAGPVVVNLLLPFVRRGHWAVAGDADGVVTFWGRPRRLTDGVWVHQCGSVEEAEAAAAAGADAVIAQGVEAGGHVRGTTPTLELTERVRGALGGSFPVWAAGGVAGRRDVESALAAGAEAVVVGTRFVMAEESGAHPAYQQRLVDADDTILTELFGAGWPATHRVVQNAATRRWLSADPHGPGWVRALHRATAPVLRRTPMGQVQRAARFQRPWLPLLMPVAPTAEQPAELVDSAPLYAGRASPASTTSGRQATSWPSSQAGRPSINARATLPETETRSSLCPMADDLRTGTHNGHLMVAALKRHGDKPVMHLGDTTLTGSETAARISQYVQAFEALGAGTGSHAALLALNRPEVLFILGAGQTQGFRRTSLHPLGSADDHAYVINDAGITTLIVDPMFTERAVALLEKCPGLEQVLTIGPVPEALAEKGRDLVAEAASYDAQPLEAKVLPPDHIVSIAYTGGTTGKPKGVIGTAQTMATMTQIQLAEWEWPGAPRFLMCTPLSHAGAAFFAPTVVKGGSLYVLSRFDPAEVLQTIEEQRITATMLVPSMLYALLDHPDSRTRDLSSLETVYYGASAINPVRLREAIDRFGPIFAQYYGQSEAPMVISYLARGEHDEKRLSSCGRPSALLRTALLGEDGAPVGVGEPGEICVAGPLLAGGYWNLPEETAETFRDDGWMHTGDIAREDEDGFWFIVDRTKDMIVTGGFNVFPREVEDVVAEHPAVAQVGVIGTPDERWGEAVTAIVVLRDGSELTDEMVGEIQALVKERKGAVQAPKRVIVADSLPLTGLGKPDKKALRAQYWEGDRSVG